MFLVMMVWVFFTLAIKGQDDTIKNRNELEVFPILSYDSDAGFGYGGKLFLLNFLNNYESFDLIVFNSTKGERWYSLIVSYPDKEIRHGKSDILSFDLDFDYDKWIKVYYSGPGNNTTYNEGNYYTKTPLYFSLRVSYSLSHNLTAYSGLISRNTSLSNYHTTDSGTVPFYNKSSSMSFQLGTNYDDRDNINNPSKGTLADLNFEYAPHFIFVNTSFNLLSFTIQKYYKIVWDNFISASRFSFSTYLNNDIPVQFLLPLGGNRTMRGFVQERFLGTGFALINSELRFPIYKRLGAIAGFDAGKILMKNQKNDFKYIHLCLCAGLRFYMDNFVVRGDIGISKETVSIYFNFGQMF